MPRRTAVLIVLAAAVTLAAAPCPAHAQATRAAAPAPPTPAPLSTERQLAFLSTAEVVTSKLIGKGVTGALRLTLRDGALTHDAAFQRVAETAPLDGRKHAGEIRFVDHYRYNLAAWRLASRLGLGAMMPATVERAINGRQGALSWWVDDVLMDEAAREQKNVQPPDSLGFVRQRQRMIVFAELVRDVDRNKGNVVYTRDWRVIMLDFTRAFRLDTQLRPASPLTICDRRLLAAMRGVTRAEVEQAVDGALTADEVTSVMGRRDKLVQHFDRLVAERGERVVLY